MKDRLILVLLGVLLLAGGIWLVSATEWVDVDVPTPAKGEALTNPLYATEKLLGALGAKVVKHKSLDAMPPPQARLVLVSRNWDLFPERAQRLRAWVAQGGHLVIPGFLARHTSLTGWLPVTEENAISPQKITPARPFDRTAKDLDCRALEEPVEVAPSYGDSRVFRVCGAYFGPQYLPVNRLAAPLWSLRGTAGTEAVRVQVGQGTVTVLGGWGLLGNSNLLRADNAQVAAAALQARAGAEFWFVAEEAREPFASWLWHQAWVALLLGLLALALALWRAGVRFGPLAPSAPSHRRSMAEQVRGTARFLHMHGPKALHTAQLRALHASAARQLPRFSQLEPARRTAEIARATGLDVRALEHAQADRARNRGALAADLELLETARRRLDAREPVPPPVSSAASSPSSS
ncbi:DUF4350 domain-containing protein [Polaromonas sp. JS666]|uniref:DUF4350 domain-containing protein n=1 Tax=Polaromonas sp. (strain JS666 / ATCC BAA-500) TaxID=296591 RepID=UPI000888A91D|nr:DUF4350 domain-containing protein [Polaromonas sp. JS666]SDN34433.1 hypothetical protein SAMN05720382_104475 [Polaromonas sp. JS666]